MPKPKSELEKENAHYDLTVFEEIRRHGDEIDGMSDEISGGAAKSMGWTAKSIG